VFSEGQGLGMVTEERAFVSREGTSEGKRLGRVKKKFGLKSRIPVRVLKGQHGQNCFKTEA